MTIKHWMMKKGDGMTAEERPMVNIENASADEVRPILERFLNQASLGFEGQVGESNERVAWGILEAAGFSRGDLSNVRLVEAGYEQHSIEWFAQQILVHLYLARDEAKRGDIDRAMMAAFTVGNLVAKVNLKQSQEHTWEKGDNLPKYAANGADILHGSQEIRENRYRERYEAFCTQLAAQGGKNVTGAMDAVAERFGVSRRTIQEDRNRFQNS